MESSTSSHCATVVLCGALLSTVSCSHGPELRTPSRELTFTDDGHLEVLDNGLSLFIAPDAYTARAQVDLRIQVGARDDPPERSGMAHLVEHLMFALPSGGPDSPSLFADGHQRALSFNAVTTADYTHFTHIVDPDEVDALLRQTAQRLDFDCASIDEETFARNREIVRNEMRWRTGDVDNAVAHQISELVFPPDHPYRFDAGGADTHLAAITREEACDFIARHYTASRATVVVTGNVSPEQVLPLAQTHLEALTDDEPAPRQPLLPLSLAGRHERLEAPTKVPMALVLFPMPPRLSEDHVSAEAAKASVNLAMTLLTGGSKSAIESSSTISMGGEQAEVFGVVVVPKRPSGLGKAVQEVHDVIEQVLSAKLEDSRLYDRMRQYRRREVIDAVAWMPGRAHTYAAYVEGGVSPHYFSEELTALDNLTPTQVHTMGQTLFARDQALVIEVLPDGEEEARAERADLDYAPAIDDYIALPDDIDPAEARRPLPFEDVDPPELQQLDYRLANGMRVLLVKSSRFPVMDAQLIVGAGLLDAPEHPELPLLSMMLYGPHEGGRFGSGRDARALMQHFEQAGAELGATVGPLGTTYRASGLSIYLDFILAGLSERVVQGEYQSTTLDRWKAAYKGVLESDAIARRVEVSRAVATALYGEGHPHAYARRGDLEALEKLGQRDLWQFHDQHYRAANSTLIVVGGFDLGLVTEYIEAFFESPQLRRRRSRWQEPQVARAQVSIPEPTPADSVVFTTTSDELVQTTVSMQFPLAEVYGDDHAALRVLTAMLDLEVRAVRERLGASYGTNAVLHTDPPRLEITGVIDSKRAPEAMAEIVAALERLRQGDDFDRRFALARRQQFRTMVSVQGDATLLAAALADAIHNGRSYDYYRELARRVAQLTPDDVEAQIEKVMDPARSVTLLMGPSSTVQQIIEHNKLEHVRALTDL